MRLVRPLLLTLATAALACLPATRALAESSAPLDSTTWTLPNGLRVVESPAAPDGSAHALLFLPAGWSEDPPGGRGVAELTASVAVQASREHDVRALRSGLAEHQATLSAHLAADYTMVRLQAPDAARLTASLPLLGEVVREPALPTALIDAACAGLLQGLRDTERDPAALAARAVVTSFAGPDAPASGVPDPWKIRNVAAGCVADFHARHWMPLGSVLALSGLSGEAARTTVQAALGSWSARAVEAKACGEPAAAMPGGTAATLLLTSPTADSVVAMALAPPSPADALLRHALLFSLASAAGELARVPAPFPASLADTLVVPVAAGTAARTLTRLRKELDVIAASGPGAGVLDAWRARLAEGDAATAATPGSAPFMAGLAAFRGVPPALAPAGALVTDAAVRDAAAALLASGGVRWAVVAPSRLLARVRDESVTPFRLAGPRDAAGIAAAEKGRTLLEKALRAQGDPARLLSLSNVDERAEGMFHGIGTHVAVRTRQVISLPASAYIESAMYNHRRFIVNRLISGEVWVDRSGIGTRPEQRFDKARLVERQALLHPAFALARATADGWMRHAGAGPDEGTEVVEVLHPVAGACRFTVRTKDLALLATEMDMSPLEPSTEVHRYDDFRVVDGIRLPFKESASASGRPWRDLVVTSVSLPATVEPAFFLTEGRPDPDVFDRPGPPDGKTDPQAEVVGGEVTVEPTEHAPQP